MRGAKRGPRKCGVKTLARMRRHFSSMALGRRGERLIAKKLRAAGLEVHSVASQKLPYDLLVAGKIRVECKAARLKRCHRQNDKRLRARWSIGIARGKRLNEECDWYVILLTGCDDMHNVYLIVKSPLRRRTLRITLRLLLTKYREDIDRFDRIAVAA